MIKSYAVIAALMGCVERPEAPAVLLVTTAALINTDAWAALGFEVAIATERSGVECPRRWYVEPRGIDCTIVINVSVEAEVRDRIGSDAASNIADRWIAIDETIELDRFPIAMAHEMGHILLDTSEHTRGGIMGGVWSAMSPADYALACRSIGICVDD